MKPFSIFSNAVRAKEILAILVRHGFGGLFEHIDMPAGWRARFTPEDYEPRSLWRRIRDACEDLGPTCVKFAQILSARPDLIPAPLIEELKHLRTHVRAVPYNEIQPLIESELGGPIDDYFVEWNPTPIACGSLAQVYRARTREGNRDVAVKAQRPAITKAIESDLTILGWLAEKLHESVEELRPYDLPSIIEETRHGIRQELNFTAEARNAHYFNTINPTPEKIFAPEPCMDLTTRRIVVYEWVDGEHAHHCSVSPEKARALAIAGGESVFHQIMIAGFFHGDPHSGNILITADHRICLVDWGLAGQLTRRMRYFLADLFTGAAAQDPEKIVRTLCLMVEGTHRINRSKLEKDVALVLRQYTEFSTRNEALGNMILELIYTFGSNNIHLSRDYALLGKAIISIEESAMHLDPDFDVRTIARPFLEKLSWERRNPLHLAQEFYWTAASSLSQLSSMPTDLHRLIHRLENGDMSMRMQLTGLDRMRASLDRAAMHMVFGVIVGSLVIGSSILIASDSEPKLWNIPILGLAGYTLAMILTLMLLWDAWRKH